jgi:nuclear pore complex protein Nup205
MFFTNNAGFIDEDDLFVDAAIDMKVFDFLHHTVLENESIYKEVVYLFLFLVK